MMTLHRRSHVHCASVWDVDWQLAIRREIEPIQTRCSRGRLSIWEGEVPAEPLDCGNLQLSRSFALQELDPFGMYRNTRQHPSDASAGSSTFHHISLWGTTCDGWAGFYAGRFTLLLVVRRFSGRRSDWSLMDEWAFRESCIKKRLMILISFSISWLVNRKRFFIDSQFFFILTFLVI